VALGDHLLTRTSDPEEPVSEAARAGIGRTDERLSGLRVMQSIIEAGDRGRGIAKYGRRPDGLCTLAIDTDAAAVAPTVEILGAREGPGSPDQVFRFLPMHRCLRSPHDPCEHISVFRHGEHICERAPSVRELSLNGSSIFDEDHANSSWSNDPQTKVEWED